MSGVEMTSRSKNLLQFIFLAVAMVFTGGSVASAAQQMEEIIVTATKREQSLQDVPVSVSVVSGEQIKNQALQDMDDLSNWVPGLSVREGGEQTGISIRGFGAGLNFGFDQSVGMFVDGIYAGRERQFRARFLDIESIEVLRGPQATLFGKNTTTGAIIVRTGEPRFDFDASASLEMGVGVRERQQFQGFVTGGLSDSVAARLAIRVSDDNGYMKNTFNGKDEEQEEDWITRLTLLWTPTDRTEVRTKVEYSEYERSGRDFQVSDVGGPFSDDTSTLSAAAQLSTYQAYDPLFEYEKDRISSKQLETADVESTNFAVEVTHDLDQGTFKSITGYSAFDSEDQRDVDWTPTNFLYEPITQEFSQVSQEFQFISDLGEKFDYILGVHWFSTDFYVDRRTDINIEPYLIPYGVTPFSDVIFGGPADNWAYAQLRFLDQQRDNFSVYGQGTYHFTPNVHLTFGLRFNREEKDADDRYFLSQFGRTEFLDVDQSVTDFIDANPTAGTDPVLTAQLIDLANAAGGDNVKIANVCSATSLCGNVVNILGNGRTGGGSLTEEDWSPEMTLSWDYSDAAMFYGKVSQGHKGGGFNSQAVGQNSDPKFEDETVVAWEVGGKFRLDYGYVNVALFRMDFENLQTSVWTGNEFDVGNAGESFSQGLEVDGLWQLSDRLQLNGSFIWNDARYDKNERNACTVPQLVFGAEGCNGANGLPYGDPNATAPFFYDLTGARFAPLFNANIGLGYVRPIMSGWDLLLRGDAVYFSDQERQDPTLNEPSVTVLDLRAEVRQTLGPWRASVLVKNATDEEHWWYQFEAPSQSGTRIGFLAPPRTVLFTVTYDMN